MNLRWLIPGCLAIIGAVSSAIPSAAAESNLVSYQGFLANGSGQPVTGSVAIWFSLYNVTSGGTALWSENQSVSVSNGVFSVSLGTSTPMPSGLFDQTPLYLGVRAGADQEMQPRQVLTSSPLAIKATLAPQRMRSIPAVSGTGSDGAFVGSGSHPFQRGTVYQFTSFNLTSTGVITATSGTTKADPIVIKVSGNCTIAGTINLAAAGMDSAQGVPDALGAGESPAGTPGQTKGGGGGAGAGGSGLPGVSGGTGGSWLSQAGIALSAALAGAGGGAGGNAQGATSHAAGGAGGGALVLIVGGDVAITGTINVSGQAGASGGGSSCGGFCQGGGGGGGGGGGSVVIYYAGTIVDAGAVYSTAGGAGGNGGPGQFGGPAGTNGGAGGSGKVMFVPIRSE